MDEYAIIIGARPNFVKASALLKRANFKVIHTGQHYDHLMSKVFLDELDIKVDVFLEFKSLGQIIKDLKEATKDCKGIIVFGDVNSTLAGAIAAQGKKLIHIEAGLRSNDLKMPEEVNRIVVDHLADMLFTTEPSAKENLLNEGIDREKIIEAGNLMIETLENYLPQIKSKDRTYDFPYYVATIHRREKQLEKSLILLDSLSLPVIFPVHPSTKIEGIYKNIIFTKPLPYLDFMSLVYHSNGVITDSGGIQEETTHLGIPCATLRDSTERPITIECGSNKLFSSIDGVEEHLHKKFRSGHIWDSSASEIIIKNL